jgi:hypothetical protein
MASQYLATAVAMNVSFERARRCALVGLYRGSARRKMPDRLSVCRGGLATRRAYPDVNVDVDVLQQRQLSDFVLYMLHGAARRLTIP